MKKLSLLLAGIVLTSLSVAQADQTLVDLVKKVKPGVVLIETFDKDNKPLSQGSGFFVNNKGHIITNHHVLEGAYSATIKTSAGKEYPVQGIVAKDIESDIIKLVVNIPDANITFLKLSVNIPSEGEDIVVIGNPLGLESTISSGIVSAVRDIPAFGKILQITAPISPGSSGSPVINSRGEVIGIATIIVTEGQNLNFAIPSDKIIALKETSKTPIFEANAAYDIELYHDKVFDVVKVVDGSTFDINFPDGSKPSTRIRLWGIDTSGTDNPQGGVTYFGPEATAFTRQLALGKSITIYLDEKQTRDEYNRLLAYIQLPDGRYLNELLLSEGYAYADLRFKHSFYYKYQQLEAAARSHSKGLWANVETDKMSNKFTSSENTLNLDNAKPIAYHSPEGHFYFTLPAGWKEIPNDTLKAVQEAQKKVYGLKPTLSVAFCKINQPYFTQPYIAVEIKKIGRLTDKDIEKLFSQSEFNKVLEKEIIAQKQKYPDINVFSNMKLGETIFDKARNLIIKQIETVDEGEKGRMVTAIILSNYGCVYIGLYSNEQNLKNDLPYFIQIIDSFRYDIGYEYNQLIKNQSSDSHLPITWMQHVPLELLIILMIIGLLVPVIIKARTDKSGFHMSWFYFYIYLWLPFTVLFILADKYKIEQTSIIPLWSTALTYGQIAIIIAVLIGLHMRRLWGWYLNWFFLVFLVLVNVLTIGIRENKIGFLVGGAVYTVLNVVYFYKRRSLFA